MIYYEENTVKKYKRKNNKDSTQINLGVNSKFKKDERVIITSRKNLNTLTNPPAAFRKAFLTELEENSKMIVDKDEHEKLAEEVTSLRDRIIELQEENKKELEEHEKELKKQRDKVEKLLILNNTKDNQINTLTSNWKWYKRIFNILPAEIDSQKI